MQVTLMKSGPILCLQIQGRLDTGIPQGFERALLRLIEKGETHLVFDFAQVEHVSSNGLRILLRAFKQITYANGRMVFHSLSERVRRSFEVAGLTMLFGIYDTREEALSGVMFTRLLPVNIVNSLPQRSAGSLGDRTMAGEPR